MRYALADVMIYVSHNRRAHHNVGTCLWHVSLQSAMFQHITQHAKGESTEKVKPTFRLKVNNGEIVVLHFFFCLS